MGRNYLGVRSPNIQWFEKFSYVNLSNKNHKTKFASRHIKNRPHHLHSLFLWKIILGIYFSLALDSLVFQFLEIKCKCNWIDFSIYFIHLNYLNFFSGNALNSMVTFLTELVRSGEAGFSYAEMLKVYNYSSLI